MLAIHNRGLQYVVQRLENYARAVFKKEITLTCVYRTKEENDELYKQYATPPKASPHMFWCAVDIRSSDFTESEIKELLDYLNDTYLFNMYKTTAIYHSILGNARHFHIQYKEKDDIQ